MYYVIIVRKTLTYRGDIIMQRSQYEQFLKQNVPMIDFTQLNIMQIDESKCIIKVPFTPQNKNHVNSMYFGAITIGTEVSAGILAYHYLDLYGLEPLLVFKDISGDFLRRAEGDVYFICEDAQIISAAIKEMIETKGRINVTAKVIGVTDLGKLDEKISDFKITISIKYQAQNSK